VEVNQVDDNGQSPLFIAAKMGWELCMVALLRAGADACLARHGGKTPLDIARERGQGNCVASLVVLRMPWTLGFGGSLKTMPGWIKDRAVMAILCLRYHKLPLEIIDAILSLCAACPQLSPTRTSAAAGLSMAAS